MHFRNSDILKIIVLLGLLYMPIFGFLDSFPIRIWDESRLAVNAYEMLQTKDFLVTSFDNEPDMWNTKPPLMIWAQVFFMRIVGVNELAVRMPSALAALFTCLGILFFSLRYLKNLWPGMIASLVLITSYGYIGHHVARTGDYDSLLTFFTTMAGLMFFSFTQTRRNLFLYLFFLLMALAILTKGITALIFAPAFLLYLLIRKQLVPLLTNKHFYLGLAGFLIISAGYYLLRELRNPGFISAVIYNEISGRYNESMDGHNLGIWYYLQNLRNYTMPFWFWFISAGLLSGLLSRDKKLFQLTLFSSVMALVFLVVISTSKTKFHWYDAPALPFLAIIISAFLWNIIRFMESNRIKKKLKYNFLPYLFLFLVFFYPYQAIYSKTNKPIEYPWDQDFYSMAYILKDAHRDRIDISHYRIVYQGYLANLHFYIQVLKDKGVDVDFKSWEHLEPGDQVIVHQEWVRKYIENHYHYHIQKQKGPVCFILIGELSGETPEPVTQIHHSVQADSVK
jgi:4-amino-4-deoxy-L-arabinose transferase-like glycosyltransferase